MRLHCGPESHAHTHTHTHTHAHTYTHTYIHTRKHTGMERTAETLTEFKKVSKQRDRAAALQHKTDLKIQLLRQNKKIKVGKPGRWEGRGGAGKSTGGGKLVNFPKMPRGDKYMGGRGRGGTDRTNRGTNSTYSGAVSDSASNRTPTNSETTTTAHAKITPTNVRSTICCRCCSVLQCVAVCCSVLQCVAVYRWLLQRRTPKRSDKSQDCSVLQCVAVCCIALKCVAVFRIALQCVAVCCSVLQHVVGFYNGARQKNAEQCQVCYVLHCVAVCCSVLKCVALNCSVLQCVETCCSVLQCVGGYNHGAHQKKPDQCHCTPKRAPHTPKKALYTPKRALHVPKRALHTPRRVLYIPRKSPIYTQTSPMLTGYIVLCSVMSAQKRPT